MTTIKARQKKAATRAAEARRLRAENPDKSLSWIAEQLGISKQRVSQLLAMEANPEPWQNSDDRWPDDMVVMMEEQLRVGVAPRELLALPGVAEMIKVKVEMSDVEQERISELGKSKALEEAVSLKRAAALRVMISRGQSRPKSSVAHRLYQARQDGLARRRAEPAPAADSARARAR